MWDTLTSPEEDRKAYIANTVDGFGYPFTMRNNVEIWMLRLNNEFWAKIWDRKRNMITLSKGESEKDAVKNAIENYQNAAKSIIAASRELDEIMAELEKEG